MVNIKITKREVFKLNKNLRMHEVINDIADIIVGDIKNGISTLSADINDLPFAPLRPSTIASKQESGAIHPSKPLFDKGKMKEVYVKKRATKGKPEAIIAPNNRDRGKVNAVHNEGVGGYTIVPRKAKMLRFFTGSGCVYSKKVNHPGQKQREWFGLSPRLNKPVEVALNRHIKKALSKRG